MRLFKNPYTLSPGQKRFEVPKAGFVELKVFDLLGQEIANLASREFGAGSHEIRLDASTLASGIYLYRFTAGTFVEARKMIVLK